MSDAPTEPTERETAALATPLRAGTLLALMAVIAVGLLAAVHELTKDRIAAQARQQLLEQLAEVLPADRHDNDLLSDTIRIRAPEALGHDQPLRVFRARLGGRPEALVMEVIAPNGYNGDIKLLLAVAYDGTVLGTRVLAHRETPGLGDPIEKRRSDWIDSFDGRSLGNPEPARWTVRKDGGAFDQFTGATITPRSVVTAIARALSYAATHREALFAAAADTLSGENNESG